MSVSVERVVKKPLKSIYNGENTVIIGWATWLCWIASKFEKNINGVIWSLVWKMNRKDVK